MNAVGHEPGYEPGAKFGNPAGLPFHLFLKAVRFTYKAEQLFVSYAVYPSFHLDMRNYLFKGLTYNF